MTYTPPQLTRVGDARDLVLGSALVGSDLDETRIIGHFEFADEYPMQVNDDQ